MLLGISGKIGSGKDTLADIIIEDFPDYIFEKKSYAYKLKYVTQIMMGVTWEDCITQEGKNKYVSSWGMTIGEFQQRLGTEGMRQGVHLDAWILGLFANYNSNCNWLITDVRFKNEAQAIWDRGGHLVRLKGDPAEIRKNSKRDMSHPSETDLDDWPTWDFEYTNDSTWLDLRNFASNLINTAKDLPKLGKPYVPQHTPR